MHLNWREIQPHDMGVPSLDDDVKYLLGDRMVTTSPSVVMKNLSSLAVKLVASSKKILHISMHAFASPAYFVSSPEKRNSFFSRELRASRG